MVQETLETLIETADVSKVYGEPIVHEDTLIIPAAEVLAVAGFGAGYGSGGPEDNGGAGGGAGGGGRTFSRPVAIVIADKNGVRVEPVMDPTKIALTFFTALGFMIATIGKMVSGKRD
ncbi:MAG TPA: sporulation protein YtfJ [Chloroflexi bacterium]|nr:sporulation protein YtfJ [Chloroflexota bacterium]